jgi:hypothetical protein
VKVADVDLGTSVTRSRGAGQQFDLLNQLPVGSFEGVLEQRRR